MNSDQTREIIRRGWNEMIEGTARRKDADVTKWYGLLHSSYDEDHRAYHNLDHIAALLQEFEQHRHLLANPKQVLAAIFFHDIIYQTAKATPDGGWEPLPAAYNEKKSARIARMALSEMGFDRVFCARVALMINATATHKVDDKQDRDLALFLDMDMSILGAPLADYKTYCKNIRAEYSCFDDSSFYKKRLQYFLRPTLKSPPVFVTPEFSERFEAQAQRNLMDEAGRIENWLDQNVHNPHMAPKPKSDGKL